MKYYPQMAPATPITLAQIVKRIKKRSTVSGVDMKAIFDALQYEVVEALQNGNSVRLADLGSFRPGIKATGSETSAEAKRTGTNAVRSVNVQFTRSVAMKEVLLPANTEFALHAEISND